MSSRNRPMSSPSSNNGDGAQKDTRAGLEDWCKMHPATAPMLAAAAAAAAAGTAPPEPRLPALPPARRRRCTLPPESQRQPSPFFAKANQLCDVLSADQSTKYTVCMFPRVDRGFFLSDKDWTCYRRNYFQVSCTFSLLGPTHPPPPAAHLGTRSCVVVDGGVPRAVSHFLIGISAQVAASNRDIELVQHTPKRDKGPQITPQPQPARPSDSFGPGVHDINTSATVCFERLQFKTATANNGKRRAAQQYYILEVELLADCADGRRVVVATSTSSPIVVRGRSPGHYADTSAHHHPHPRHPHHQHTASMSSVSSLPSFPPSSMAARGLRVASMDGSLPPGPLLTQAHPPPGGIAPEHPGGNGGYVESSAVAAAAAVAASGYEFSAGDVVQALSGMAPPGAVPPPQEILSRAHNMALDPFGIQGLAAGAGTVAGQRQPQPQDNQQQHVSLAPARPIPENSITSDVSLAAKTIAAGEAPDGAIHISAISSQLQPAAGPASGITIDPSPAGQFGGSDSLSLFQGHQGLLDAQPPSPSAEAAAAGFSGSAPGV
ncbi:hypothetical protein H4R18_000280 [Coemansia javaensis]|uniref:NDT80 domain-containing protein n=1 Tax=Coemansia javaensis TaxID=2761396 RepID=A0A9W8LNB9_9FUNG|nr:hypothetical protein H4R18_000280 [Coemansia javaensis]